MTGGFRCQVLGPLIFQARFILIMLIAILGLGWGTAVRASSWVASAGELAEMSLEDLMHVEVQGASRFLQPLADSPASVVVIDRKELSDQGYRNVAEALSSLPGIYVSNDRSYSYLGVRGFSRPGDYNSRVLLLTDGARRNDALYEQAHIGNESPVEIDWVKRLEFVYGPAYAIYGANALYGIANAVMLEGGDVDGARLTADAASGRGSRLGLVAGRKVDTDLEWFFGLTAYSARGKDLYFPAFDNGATDGWARGLDGEKYQKAYAKLRLGNWRLTGNLSWREKSLPNAPYETMFGIPGTRILDQHALFEVAYDGLLANGWQQQFRAFQGGYRYVGDYHYAGQRINRDQGHAQWMGGDYRLSKTVLETHKLMWGVEGQWNRQLDQKITDLSAATNSLDSQQPSRVWGVFVQDEWRLHEHWLLNMGVRHDQHSDFASFISPRVALIYQPDSATTLKAMAGSAYRAPNAYERFYSDRGASQKANPALLPEHIRSTELAADFRVGQGGRLGVSVYRNHIRNMIDQVQDPTDGFYLFTNQSQVQSHGIEFSAERRWVSGHRLRGSVTRQQSRLADGSELGSSPHLVGKLVWSAPLASGWVFAGQWQGLSSRRSLSSRVPGAGVVNLTVTSPGLGGLGELVLGVYNLGNRNYFDPASSAFSQDALAQDDRQLRLRWILPL